MAQNSLQVILTGVTGMIGEGVLLECLEHPAVEKVLAISRRPSEYRHPKLEEIIHSDFFDLSPLADRLLGFDACFFCAGVSSMGMKENEYFRLTHTMTMHFAETLAKLNPGSTFCYVSGAGTDTTEQGRLMWARVKGKTENDLQKLNLKAFNFRPAMMIPHLEAKHAPRIFWHLSGLFDFMDKLFPNLACPLDIMARAMIHLAMEGPDIRILEVSDMRRLADPR